MSILTADAAVHHPADHTQQEEQVAHEVAVVPASCRREGGSVSTAQVLLVVHFLEGLDVFH